MCFILKNGIELKQIILKAKAMFNSENSTVFTERIFLEQLTYYEDVSYEEEVNYLVENAPTNNDIMEALKNFAFEYMDKR